MASQKNRVRGEEPESNLPPWFNEVAGIALIGVGLILILSLITFTPHDMPILGIGGMVDNEPNIPRENSIGVVGALFAYFILFIFGAAGYLLPIGLLWLGVAYAFMGAKFSKRTLIGLVCFVLCGSCLLAVTELLSSWAVANHFMGSGGFAGHWLGSKVLEGLLNKTGAVILLVVLYLIGMIMLTGLHPIQFSKVCWVKFQEWRVKRLGDKERIAEKESKRAARDAEKLARQQEREAAKAEAKAKADAEKERAKEEKAKKEDVAKKARVEEEKKNPQVEMDLKEIPKPKIVDSSQRKKPRMDPGSKPFEKKKQDGVSLSTEGFEDYELPGFDLLTYDDSEPEDQGADQGELLSIQKTIVDTLKAFGVDVSAGDITRGPTITRYEVYPSMGLRVSRITQLEADIARATKAERINILAPIPGKDTVGIEIANDNKVAVPLRELLQDEAFTSAKKKIPLALGKDVYGNTVIGDLAAMPHLLVAGATGAGKSVCINSIITSILFKFSPDELRFIMVDPKVVEMQVYGNLPHLVVPVVTDPNKVVAALRWVVNEMEKRYRLFAKCGVRNFDGYNSRPRPEKEEEPEVVEPEENVEVEEEPDPEVIESIARALEDGELGPSSSADDEDELDLDEDEMPDRFPYIVVIIDELADLMQTAPADVEMNIARIAQKARAAGIHLIIATQTPRADVVTGIIKANIPSRIAFQVSSALDSRVILDTKGADKLVGKGDMLYLPPGSAKLERAQGAFVSDEEVEAIVEHCSNQTEQKFEESIQQTIEQGGVDGGDDGNDVSDADEECLLKCIEVITTEQKASTSLLQRRLRLGYTRAARMMDILEERGMIGPADGAKARDIYI
ncbi:DNA translocase FtsK 4TM domain-containing protein [Rubritalea spongiae]|uniref:DNA translocase FtsK 4TM domain-containing protein n=1 Tax=Rubritalea spongiae TaxID=430797 RepID=A0ABW5DXW3_9BACT